MLKEIEYSDDQQEYLNIRVTHIIHPSTSFVSYNILLETTDPSFSSEKSVTSRRYSEFRILHTLLTKQFPFEKFPSLPPKAPFQNRFSPSLIQRREIALQEYLEQVCSKRICLSSKALHLFLQSSLTIEEIKSVINGVKTDIHKVNQGEKSVVSTLKNFMSRAQIIEGTSNQVHEGSEVGNGGHSDSLSSTSSPGSKRVSFCENVTVAEILPS